MHRLLRRQLRRHLGAEQVPEDLQAFVAAVDNAYEAYERDYSMMEHALELSSAELLEQNEALAERNQTLSETLEQLKQAQKQLVEAEKLASLGGLVAGIAHEVNTPVGIAVTSASHLAAETKKLQEAYDGQRLTASMLAEYIDEAQEASRLLAVNTNRAAELIHSFKQVAVDQSSDERRSFELGAYVDEVLVSLWPQVKRTRHTVATECPAEVTVNSYPGAIAQVLTNLLTNAITHAFEPEQAGRIRIEVASAGEEQVRILFSDNGRGIPDEVKPRLFEPFFTTARGRGGSGLGLNILHNIVHRKLNGEVRVEDNPEGGTQFIVVFPREAE